MGHIHITWLVEGKHNKTSYYVPATQAVQLELPEEALVPALHVIHDEAPEFEYVPAAQLEQLLEPDAEYVPAAQVEQEDVPAEPEYYTSHKIIK